MIAFSLEFLGNGTACSATVELEGSQNDWTAHAKVSGHPTISDLHFANHLGEYLRPLFSNGSEIQFFAPLAEAIEQKVGEMLPASDEQEPATV